MLDKIGNALMGFSAGVRGEGQDYIASQNLKQLGSQLANGGIDQSQYLKSIAQYSPDTYNKMLITQMQSTPAAVKINNTIQQLRQSALEAYNSGDQEKAKNLIDQANTIIGTARADAYGTNPYSLPNSQPTNNAVTSAPIAPIPGSKVVVPIQGETVSPAEKAAQMIPSDDLIPPERLQGEPTKMYKARLDAWNSRPEVKSAQKEGESAGSNTVKYSDKIAEEAKAAINMHQTIAELRQAMNQFQAGALAPAQGTILKYARAAGFPLNEEQVSKLSNQQVFTKMVNDILAERAKSAGQSARLVGEFNALKSSNPNIGMEPESLNTLFDVMDSKAGEITDEQQAWNLAKKNNPKLSGAEFVRSYTANRAAQQEQAGGNIPKYKGASNSTITKTIGNKTYINKDGKWFEQ